MKIRMYALAGVATLALSGPTLASDATGWYVDLSAGLDHMGQYTLHNDLTGVEGKVETDNAALVTGAWGYRFPDRLRVEGELGWDYHNSPVGQFQITSLMLNAAYDLPLSPKWDFSFGGGGGIGVGDVIGTIPGIAVNDSHSGYMYQGFAGFAYSLTRNVDLTFDWRYRNLAINKAYVSVNVPNGTAHVKDTNEQAWMIGIRWYPWAAPPPPPPPPPVKTFIVFFDFNKSDLTTEAQSVVTEAVKVAKTNGFVKVIVTGHTDTVGSDSYNMGLSVRRAEAVKDEMVHQGMDGAGISIEGKGFHDLLVPTGPGVREPQNRRAVIDLGS